MLRATTALRYNSKDLEAGEEFEPASEADAMVLKAAGKAEDVQPSEERSGLFETPHTKPKRKYQRRDMRAED